MMLFDLIKNKKIILGSASPRRQELLRLLGIDFETRISNSDESYQVNLSPEEIPIFLAIKKKEVLKETIKANEILITADTIVVKEEEILNKPKDEQEACEMLSSLSNDMHQVITGVCISNHEKQEVFSVTTNVFFKKLTIQEIDFYVKEYKPFDKAGAYGIQEWIGLIGIKKITGCYFNVVGLPVAKLYQKLIQFDAL